MSIQTAMKQVDDSLIEAQTSLETAKSDVIRWEGQLAKLTEAKTALSKIFTADDFAPPPAKAGKPAAKKAAAKGGVAIPKTDSAFWHGLLTATPQTTKEILDLATAKLEVTDSDAIDKLRGRQTSYLQTAAKDGVIKSEGERLNRKYFV
jgi:hypothetical protein